MKMFVANCSQQDQHFMYRLPEQRRMREIMIPIGGQVMLPDHDKLSVTDIEAVVKQHSQYGMVDQNEAIRTRHFSGLCYNLDKPVDLDRVRFSIERNLGVLEDRGKRNREAAAVAVHDAMEAKAADSGMTVRNLEMTIQEEGDSPSMAEGMRVTREDGRGIGPRGPAPAPVKAAAKRRRKA
ncbi:MAG: hypothetical protein ACEQSH_00075 [Bacteroidia bacterium]